MARTASHRGREREKAENEFSGFIPLAVPRLGASPHIPAPRLFILFHPTMPKSPPNPSSIHQVESIQSVGSVGSIASIHSKKRNIPYWYCLQCTPSLTLPPSSLKCLQNFNPSIHRKCFKCFGCFRCFISLLDHKTARFWSKSELNPQTAGIVPPPYHGYGKHPKRQSTHLHASPHTILSCKL